MLDIVPVILMLAGVAGLLRLNAKRQKRLADESKNAASLKTAAETEVLRFQRTHRYH